MDSFVFPELDKLRSDDSLEARFNAFKIPESNFLVFEATVRSCRDGCQPAYCPGQSGRSEPSFGRRRRSLNDTDDGSSEVDASQVGTAILNSTDSNDKSTVVASIGEEKQTTNNDYPEHVREMIEVFESRDEMQTDATVPRKLMAPVQTICLSPSEYHGLISGVILLVIMLLSIAMVSGLAYRRYWSVMMKNRSVDRSPSSSFIPSTMHSSHHNQFNSSQTVQGQTHGRSNLNLFNGGLQKTFATG